MTLCMYMMFPRYLREFKFMAQLLNAYVHTYPLLMHFNLLLLNATDFHVEQWWACNGKSVHTTHLLHLTLLQYRDTYTITVHLQPSPSAVQPTSIRPTTYLFSLVPWSSSHTRIPSSCEQVHSRHPVSTELPVDAVEESVVWLFAGIQAERCMHA